MQHFQKFSLVFVVLGQPDHCSCLLFCPEVFCAILIHTHETGFHYHKYLSTYWYIWQWFCWSWLENDVNIMLQISITHFLASAVKRILPKLYSPVIHLCVFRTRKKPYCLILDGALHKLSIQAHFMFPELAHFPLYMFPTCMVICKNSLSPNATGINCKNPMA